MTIRYPLFSTFILSLVALCFATSVSALDDDAPEITARVARISVLKGNAQVRRKGATEWEKATLNFPLAEGDEIVLDDDARVEVQLDSKNYLRIGEKSRVVMTTLKDEGVAVSLMTGDLVLRIGSFDESKNFFEVDAPGTTVAVRARGLYRIDAGDASSDTVQLSVGDGGEARIYSDQSGFTVRDGRSAKLYLSGYRAGEWETLAADFSDKLSDWSEDRDKSITKKLKNAYFGQYYDNDQFGAEDLTDYGDWVYTSQYGYVWRPYSNTTGYYRNWSPYRYGHWTWFPPYGWTWVNDEPWGWATYHHGRWIYLSSGWYWSPYASVRWSRSWWTPAFVTIAVYNGNVYWYPLGYYSRYYDYNCGYFGRSGRGGGGGNRGGGNGGGNGNTYPFPNGGDRFKQKPIDRVPPSGVVAVDDKDFGRTRGGGKTAPPDVINQIVNGEKGTETWNKIEDYIPGGRRGGGDIAGDNATLRQLGPPVRTGAGQRTSGTALDSQLEKQVILQDRIPSRKPPVRVGGDPNDGDGSRGAGVLDRTTAPPTGGRFDRKPVDRESGNSDERGTTTTNNDGSTSSGGRYNQRPIDRTGGNNSSNGSNNTNNSSSPNGRFTPKPVDRSGGYNSGGSTTYNTQRKEEPPSTPSRKYDPPVRTSPPAPKYEPPVTRTPPERKYEPPVRNNPPAPKYEPPKSSPPSRSEPPRSSPPSRTPPSSDGGSTLQRKAPPKVPDDQ